MIGSHAKSIGVDEECIRKLRQTGKKMYTLFLNI